MGGTADIFILKFFSSCEPAKLKRYMFPKYNAGIWYGDISVPIKEIGKKGLTGLKQFHQDE